MSNTFNTVPTQAPTPTQTHTEPFIQPHAQPQIGSPTEPRGDTPINEPGHIAEATAEAAHRVADSGREGVARVTDEAKTQTQGLIDETRTQLTEQAGTQQARAAKGLHAISDELSTMVRTSDTTGVAHDLVQQIATRAESVSSWLGTRDPAAVLQEVRTFARRKPGTFIALAVTVGVLAGRLTRNVVANESESSSTADDTVAGGTARIENERGAV